MAVSVEVQYYYNFDYYINRIGFTGRLKRAEAEKTCEQRYLERLIDNLPPYFDKNIDNTFDYFDPTKPGNADKNYHVIKSLFSCIAHHFCDAPFSSSDPTLERAYVYISDFLLTGDDKNYGMDYNLSDALDELDLETAAGFWLDYWGLYFLEPSRREGETDALMRSRMKNSLDTGGKITIQSISDVLEPYLGYAPTIVELWDDTTGTYTVGTSGLPEFQIDKIKNIKRRRARIVIELEAIPPPDDASWVTDVSITDSDNEYYNSYVVDESLSTGPGIAGDESFLFQTNLFELGNISLYDLKKIVDRIKPAGLKVYYKVGADYSVI